MTRIYSTDQKQMGFQSHVWKWLLCPWGEGHRLFQSPFLRFGSAALAIRHGTQGAHGWDSRWTRAYGVRKVWTLTKISWPGIKLMDFPWVLGKLIIVLDFSRAGKHFFVFPGLFSNSQTTGKPEYYQNIGYILNIRFIVDRCHCSSTVVTLTKYNCDLKDPKYIFGISDISMTEKSTNGTLVTPPLICNSNKCYYVFMCFLTYLTSKWAHATSELTLRYNNDNMIPQLVPEKSNSILYQ